MRGSLATFSFPEHAANFLLATFSRETSFTQINYVDVESGEFLGDKCATPLRSVVVLFLIPPKSENEIENSNDKFHFRYEIDIFYR